MKIDKTGIGQPAAERLLKRPGEFEVAGEGINFTGTKDGLLGEGQNAIQKRQVTFPYIKELVNSLILYQDKDKGLFTDPVFALCLAISAANQVTGRGKSRAALPVLVMPTYAKINKVFTMEEQEEEDDDGLQWIPSYV